MTEVRRSARRTLLRRWARVVAFAFGMPLLVFVVGVLSDSVASASTPVVAVSMAVAAVTTLVAVVRVICDFSVTRV